MKHKRHYSFADRILKHFDQGLRTVFAPATATRHYPAQKTTSLSDTDRRHSAALMRVNHAGEVSAQALYHAQALTARSKHIREVMQHAAQEENDHLAWCEKRLQKLNSHTSYLNPLWYTGSFAIGICAGLAGDKWNLGFLAETERQVVRHLDQHLKKLSPIDTESAEVLKQMREDEAHHATTACTAGAAELPFLVKVTMRGFSKVMTSIAYWM